MNGTVRGILTKKKNLKSAETEPQQPGRKESTLKKSTKEAGLITLSQQQPGLRIRNRA